MASVGFAVGLGKIWRFPYVTGENGGGAFVLVYLLFVFAIGVPCVMAELMVGRRGQSSPLSRWRRLLKRAGAVDSGVVSVAWVFLLPIRSQSPMRSTWVGCSGTDSGSDMTGFAGYDAAMATSSFNGLLADGSTMLIMTILGNLIVGGIIYAGVTGGIERAVTFMMPLLFALLVGLGIYNMFAGGFGETLSWLFTPDFSKIDGPVLLAAVGRSVLLDRRGYGWNDGLRLLPTCEFFYYSWRDDDRPRRYFGCAARGLCCLPDGL